VLALGVPGSNGHVVEQAESHAAVLFGVMTWWSDESICNTAAMVDARLMLEHRIRSLQALRTTPAATASTAAMQPPAARLAI